MSGMFFPDMVYNIVPVYEYCAVNLTEKLLVNLDPGLYFYINQGCLTVDHMDDKEEMQVVEVRFNSRHYHFLSLSSNSITPTLVT